MGGEQSMMRQDKQRAAAGAAKHHINGPLGNVYFSNLHAGGVIYKDLPVSDIDITFCIHSHTLAAAFSETPEIAEASIGLNNRTIRAIF